MNATKKMVNFAIVTSKPNLLIRETIRPIIHDMTGMDNTSLPEAPDRYFLMDETTALIPLDDLVPDHLRVEAVPRALEYMRAAYEGRGAKRAPITVRHRPDGRFDIADGNTTFHVTRNSGW